MGIIDLNNVSGTARHRSVQAGSHEFINLYPELDDSNGGKSQVFSIGTPGFALICQLQTIAEIRAMYSDTSSDNIYVLCGRTFSAVSGASETVLGYVESATGRATIADNGNEVFVVAGEKGYIYKKDDYSFTEVTDLDFPDCTHVTAQNGYFIVNKVDTGEFYVSGLLDGFTWSSLQYATAEGTPDSIIALKSNGENLWLFGTQSAEAWYYSGETVPFNLVPGGHHAIGCSAAYSVAQSLDTLLFLGGGSGGKGQVFMTEGYQIKKISTHSIDYEIGAMTTTSDAIGYCYNEEGHRFYVLSFPTAKKTFCYDITTGMWHKRTYWNQTTGTHEDHIINYAVYLGGYYYGADRRNNGRIHRLKLDYYSDNGEEIRRERITPHIGSQGKRLRHNGLMLDMLTGQGTITGGGSTPSATLTMSDDGGHTYKRTYDASTGAMGEYGTKVEWRRLGMSRDRIYKISVSDPVKTVISNIYLDAEGVE